MRIVLVDNLLTIRSGIECILRQWQPEVQIEVAATDTEALDVLRRSKTDLVIVCASMMNRRGLKFIGVIAREYPELPILALDKGPDAQRGIEAFQSGARGYLPMTEPQQELFTAIQRCVEGGHYIPEELAVEFAVITHERDRVPPHERFSQREQEVFMGLARGVPVTKMAESLGISVKTVSTYRARVLEKLHAESNAELVRYAAQRGFV